MYKLPIAGADQSSFALHEHTAFLLVTGLLHEDLDDQLDTLRGALEIDPLLASWCVCVADATSGIQLSSMQSAARWLAENLSHAWQPPRSPLETARLNASQRASWRSISTDAVATARRALQLARQAGGVVQEDTFWLAMLLATKTRLDDFASQNGHSPLREFSLRWPQWVQKRHHAVLSAPQSADSKGPLYRTLRELETRRLPTGLIRDEERALWFRPYPEFHALAPLLLKKLRRLQALEEQFEETLQAEKLASLQQLAYGASHEINNPLANISTRAQTLMYNESDADRRRKLVAINDQAFRAYEMIADLMLFANPPKMEISEVELGSLLRAMRHELETSARERDITIRLHLEKEPLWLRADATQLGVAFQAICKNGLESMAEGGVLSIFAAYATQPKAARVTIEDQGMGISEAAKRHLFDPFFSGREAGRGLGFGLSKAWRIVQQHHGRIEVSSQPSKGSRFVVNLPVAGPATSGSRTGLALTRTHEWR